ncbi:hypothetical protein BDR26DRAFT_873469 [Obelidium mucronatum]|nr:hypothetical protein BDR26DRAFT_873469 [Obelidium mucronatum]
MAGLWEAVCDSNDHTNDDYHNSTLQSLLLSRKQILQLHKFAAYGVDTVTCPTDGVVARMPHSSLYVARSLLGSAYCRHSGFFCIMTTTTTTTKPTTTTTVPTTTLKTSPEPSSSSRTLNFALGPAARQVLLTPNAGGDSIVSECLSVELLSRLVFANDACTLVATEMDAKYYPSGGSMTDYVIRWGHSANVSVSVTRVFDGATKKLRGVAFARRSLFAPVCGTDCSWVLHVFVPNGKVAKVVKRAWTKVDERVRGGVVVVVTIWSESVLYDRTR